MKDAHLLTNTYKNESFSREDLDPDPIKQFAVWFQQAQDVNVYYPNAFSLATASLLGAVSSRTMLLRYFDERGFVFFTGYQTEKAAQMAENPQAAMLFMWLVLERQVKITGSVEKISKGDTVKFFMSRSKASQIGAWLSQSSEVLSSKSILRAKLEEFKRMYESAQVPLPGSWGGYRVIPELIEFWQGRANGLHDRFLFSRRGDRGWGIERLNP